MTSPEPNMAVLMFVAHRHVEREVMAALAHAGYAVTPAQSRVFQRIGPDGTRLTDLADQAMVTKQTAGFLVDQLAAAGYVERVADPADGRARLVRVAPRGERAAALAADVVAAVEARWREALGPDRFDQLRSSLLVLRATAE